MGCPRLPFIGLGLGHRIAQQLGVGMERALQHGLHQTGLDDVAAQHDGDTVADVVGRRQVVRAVTQPRRTFLVLRNQIGSHDTITYHQRGRHYHILPKRLGMFDGINHQLRNQLAQPLARLADSG